MHGSGLASIDDGVLGHVLDGEGRAQSVPGNKLRIRARVVLWRVEVVKARDRRRDELGKRDGSEMRVSRAINTRSKSLRVLP